MTTLRRSGANHGLFLSRVSPYLRHVNFGAAPGPEPTDDIVVGLTPSRTSGVAPLAVHFSAIGTTSTIEGVSDTFRQLLYTFDYGDDGAGNWPISGGSKNQDVGGPLGAHVFETPGTYTVRCTASRGGSSNFEEVTITVQDPATVYAGTNTIFVSTSGNYAGAPSGAQTVTSVPAIISNRRYLLRPGESFGAIDITQGNASTQLMAAPGLAGAKPQISSLIIGPQTEPPNGNFPEDITVANLQVNGQISQGCAITRMLLLNLDQVGTYEITLGANLGYYADPSRYGPTMPFPLEIFVVGCAAAGDSTDWGMIGNMFRGALMGCDFKGADQHTVRLFSAVQAFIGHNDISGPSASTIRHSLKLHSAGADEFVFGGDHSVNTAWASRHVVVANNVLSDVDDLNEFASVFGPQGTAFSEGLQDFIIENNRYKRGPNAVGDVEMAGSRMTAINNTRFSDGSPASVSAPGLHAGGLPDGWPESYFLNRD